MRARILLLLMVAALLPARAFAQPAGVTSYQVNHYVAGASTPTTQEGSLASAASCNQTDPGTVTNPTNPTKIVWTDVAHTGKVCILPILSSTVLAQLPAGAMETTLIQINAVGASPESSRVAWTHGTVLSAATGVHLAP